MITWSSLSAGLTPSFLRAKSSAASSIDIPPATVHDLNDDPEKRARSLNALLKANHLNHSVLYNSERFHNHAPHILGSAYILGATDSQLKAIYDVESSSLEPWPASPGEITRDDWREYLGNKTYQRAYLDYFEDQLVGYDYDWKALIHDMLTSGERPLIHNAFCGLGHAIIHLGYAYELASRTVATEGLTLAACCYDSSHKYLDDPGFTRPAADPSDSLFELLHRVQRDDRFKAEFPPSTLGQDPELLDLKPNQEALLLEYWNSWTIENIKAAFEQTQRLAATILVGAVMEQYNFFIVHLLTSSHALRVLLPLFEDKWHTALLRQWWLFVLSVYIARSRPKIDPERIAGYETKGRTWDDVVHAAVNEQWSQDEHFVKACRAFRESAAVWGDSDGYFLRAALKFVDRFNGWGFD